MSCCCARALRTCRPTFRRVRELRRFGTLDRTPHAAGYTGIPDRAQTKGPWSPLVVPRSQPTTLIVGNDPDTTYVRPCAEKLGTAEDCEKKIRSYFGPTVLSAVPTHPAPRLPDPVTTPDRALLYRMRIPESLQGCAPSSVSFFRKKLTTRKQSCQDSSTYHSKSAHKL